MIGIVIRENDNFGPPPKYIIHRKIKGDEKFISILRFNHQWSGMVENQEITKDLMEDHQKSTCGSLKYITNIFTIKEYKQKKTVSLCGLSNAIPVLTTESAVWSMTLTCEVCVTICCTRTIILTRTGCTRWLLWSITYHSIYHISLWCLSFLP